MKFIPWINFFLFCFSCSLNTPRENEEIFEKEELPDDDYIFADVVYIRIDQANYQLITSKLMIFDNCKQVSPDEPTISMHFSRFKKLFPDVKISNELLHLAYPKFLYLIEKSNKIYRGRKPQKDDKLKARKAAALKKVVQLQTGKNENQISFISTILAITLYNLLDCVPKINYFGYLASVEDPNFTDEISKAASNYLRSCLLSEDDNEADFYHENLIHLVRTLIKIGVFKEQFRTIVSRSKGFTSSESDPNDQDFSLFYKWYSDFIVHTSVVATFSTFDISTTLLDIKIGSWDNALQWLMLPTFLEIYINRNLMEKILLKLVTANNQALLKWLLDLYAFTFKLTEITVTADEAGYSQIVQEAKYVLDEEVAYPALIYVLSKISLQPLIIDMIKLFAAKGLINIYKNDFSVIRTLVTCQKFSQLKLILKDKTNLSLPESIVDLMFQVHGANLFSLQSIHKTLVRFTGKPEKAATLTIEMSKFEVFSDLVVEIEDLILLLLVNNSLGLITYTKFDEYMGYSNGLMSLAQLKPDLILDNQGKTANRVITHINMKVAFFFDQVVHSIISTFGEEYDCNIIQILFDLRCMQFLNYLVNSRFLKRIRNPRVDIFRHIYAVRIEYYKSKTGNESKDEQDPIFPYLRLLLQPHVLKQLNFHMEGDEYGVIVRAIQENDIIFLKTYFSSDNVQKIGSLKNVLKSPIVNSAISHASNQIIELFMYLNIIITNNRSDSDSSK